MALGVAVPCALAGQKAAAAPLPVLRVAAAADLQFAMPELAEQFGKKGIATLEVTYGSSGNFFSQIQNGAPFDLFFSADLDYAKKLDAAGLVEPGTLCEYAVGRLVLWTRANAVVDVAKDGWKALLDARVEKIAVANPEHAPYGKAAVAAMRTAGIYQQVKNKLVYGENISQTAQFVQSGNAQIGLLAMSLALSPAMKDGRRWDVPADAYPPIEQGAVVLRDAKNKSAAQQFLEFVQSTEGRDTLKKYGFSFAAPAR
ncbi:MAG TPA: molybdate ABC transporter substrate-binding protein [Candidatus Acidoferrum sp.]|nr:molybdate ABC transporter substrate-binding protein [Candidatus Acidoferrum sp.]